MLAPQRMDITDMLRRGESLRHDEDRLARIDAGAVARAETEEWPIEACIAGAEMEENFIHGSSPLRQPRGLIPSMGGK
jgi:hypothetical protein